MINKVAMKRFKPFLNAETELKGLTYVLGENGVGKSSIAQSLLLLKQTFDTEEAETLNLNGSLIKVGNGVDALNQNANEDSIDFMITLDSGERLSVSASYIQDSDSLPMEQIDDAAVSVLRATNVVYLSADRVGPQLLSAFSASDAAKKRVSERGENALALLHAHQRDTLEKDDPRLSEAMDSLSVKSAFDYYLSRISSGASIDVANLSNVDSVSSTVAFGKSGSLPTERIRPTNVGFGLSYAASIIIACLLASPGDLLIIENPEAHLHTKGQRTMADLLARTARSGVQILCETHSRDFLYTTRNMIADGSVPEELVSCNLVYRDDTNSMISEWFPLTKPFHELGEEFEQFLEFFGSPMDYMQSPGGY